MPGNDHSGRSVPGSRRGDKKIRKKAGPDMKSLLISSDFPPVLGGISTVFYNIWRYLPPEFLALVPRAGQSRQLDAALAMRIFRAPVPVGDNIIKKLLRTFMFLIYSLVIVNRERVSYIQAGQPIVPGMIAVFLKKFLKIRFNVWVYGGEIVKYRNKKIIFKILQCVLTEADMIIANSEFTREVYVLQGFPKEKIVKITPAVDTEVFKPGLDIHALQSRYTLGAKKVILTVARLSQRKGHDTVMRALARIKDAFPDLVYLIVGTGPDEKRLRIFAEEQGVADRVIFCGVVRDEDLPLYYNSCDIHVMPNRQVEGADTLEGFGLSFIEAGACARPVIGGRSGGSGEAVLDQKTGFLIEPLDFEALADRIAYLLSDKQTAQKMGEEGRARAIEHFQWKERALIIEKLFSNGQTQKT
jgi:phosphatidyl-myo-inositol dimannoside synthase